MNVKVVDASAVAAVLFAEAAGDEMAVRLHEASSLFAPTLLDYELASICLKKMRSSPDRRDALLTMLSRRLNLRIEPVDVGYVAAVRLASQTGLTSYDASYLWLALHLDTELVTLDRKLAAAAARQRH